MKGHNIILLLSLITLLSCNTTQDQDSCRRGGDEDEDDNNYDLLSYERKKVEDLHINLVKNFLNSLKDNELTRMGGPNIKIALDAKQKLSEMEAEHKSRIESIEKKKSGDRDFAYAYDTQIFHESNFFENTKKSFYLSLYTKIFEKDIKPQKHLN